MDRLQGMVVGGLFLLAGLMINGNIVWELLIDPNGRFNQLEIIFVLGFAITISLIGIFLFSVHFHRREVKAVA
jgi:pilus assembly protein TadC